MLDAGIQDKAKTYFVFQNQKVSSKNMGIFQYNPLSIKAVIPYIFIDCPFVARSTDMTVEDSKACFPVDDVCKLVCLMDTGRSQNLLCVPESESVL